MISSIEAVRVRPSLSFLTLLALILSSLLFARQAGAEQHFKIDPASSEVHFAVTDTVHSVHGIFHLTSGMINFDRSSNAISGQIVVDAGSGNSDSKARDKKMAEDELKAGLFPTVMFAPTHFTGTIAETGDSTVQVTGQFTLVGTAHTITVPMTLHIEGTQCTATGTFPVPYVNWGMKDPSLLFLRVGKVVTINLKLAGSISQ